MTPEQQVLNAKLDDIYAVVLAIAQEPAPAPAVAATQKVEPWEVPELTADQVLVDGRTINADGSKWTKDNSGNPMQLEYGYISEGKNPAMYGRMLALAGSRDRLEYALGTNRLARYKNHPDSHLLAGDPNWITLSQMLAAALPPAMPGTPPDPEA